MSDVFEQLSRAQTPAGPRLTMKEKPHRGEGPEPHQVVQDEPGQLYCTRCGHVVLLMDVARKRAIVRDFETAPCWG